MNSGPNCVLTQVYSLDGNHGFRRAEIRDVFVQGKGEKKDIKPNLCNVLRNQEYLVSFLFCSIFSLTLARKQNRGWQPSAASASMAQPWGWCFEKHIGVCCWLEERLQARLLEGGLMLTARWLKTSIATHCWLANLNRLLSQVFNVCGVFFRFMYYGVFIDILLLNWSHLEFDIRWAAI